MRPTGASPRDQTMKEAIDTSPSRRQVLRLAAMVTACAVAAKAPNAAEPLKGETSNAYVPADGVSTFERDIFQTFSGQLPRTLWRASLIPCCLSCTLRTRVSIRRMSRNIISLQTSLSAHCDAGDCSVRFQMAAFRTLA